VDRLIYALAGCFDASVSNMLLPASRSSAITDLELPSAKRLAQTLDGGVCPHAP